ncbi:LPS export ABC transporter periplasmic protein LptC [Chitiniphilus purpureus]|uniref:LPS export ABC transporter periplasmic protein LptC n=1 Tax=Chitiniphilus purpureus TaxID=2981137 RepID=A0ABY6DM38_9NEIS|nr:LPS export ABC transporter periplasmic protein LptC [Chitiniphilus sp. CD1]UXY15273.1 LPS export ABC transporter periplasmic protein LptC [Chitiniphilus sp. CD1]
MHWSSRFLPLLLLAVLGVLVWLLNEAARLPAVDTPLRPGEPDLVIEGIDAMRFNETGQPLLKIKARRTRHYPGDNSTWFDSPHLTYTAPDQPVMQAVTTLAQGLQDSKRVWFPHPVTVVRAADGEHAELTIRGREVWLTTDTRRAWSDAAVKADMGPYHASGVGFEADMIAGTLLLKSKVSTVYEPPRR